MSLNKNSLLEHNQNGPIKNSGGILSVNPEICTVLISDFFHHSNPGSQLPAKIWQKDKKRKNKEWNPSSTIRSHLSGRIISSSRRIYLSMNNKTESFFICWFWVYQLFSQCHYSRKHYDTSPPLPRLIIDAQNLNFHPSYRLKQRGLYLLFSGVCLNGTAAAATKWAKAKWRALY